MIVETFEKSDPKHWDQQHYYHEHPKRNLARGFACPRTV
jgi:hypothetical protein